MFMSQNMDKLCVFLMAVISMEINTVSVHRIDIFFLKISTADLYINLTFYFYYCLSCNFNNSLYSEMMQQSCTDCKLDLIRNVIRVDILVSSDNAKSK